MNSNKKVTPVSQRGIGAFLSGQNASKYAKAKEPKRGRPPKQHGTPNIGNGEGVLVNGVADVAIPSAILQPATADKNASTPLLPDNSGKLKRKLSDILEEGESSEGKDSEDGKGEDSDDSEGDGGDSAGADGTDEDCDSDNGDAPVPHISARPAPKQRAQTQRVHKGQGDGSWRQQQALNPNKWQLSY